MSDLTIRVTTEQDYPHWCSLYRLYAEFYAVPMNAEILDNTWSWIIDPEHELQGFLAFIDNQETPCGLAHIRGMPSPLRGVNIGFLDDLFVHPDARGQHVGKAIFATLGNYAKQKNWRKIRWITADDNYRARGLYDQIAHKTQWNTYEMEID